MSFYIPEAPSELTFEVKLTIERSGYPDLLPSLSTAQARPFRGETTLTAADARIASTAHELAAQHQEPLALATAINTWV